MPYISEDDLTVPIKDIVTVKLRIISSLDYNFEGVMALECYQEISQQFGTIDRGDNLCFISQKKVPFVLPKNVRERKKEKENQPISANKHQRAQWAIL